MLNDNKAIQNDVSIDDLLGQIIEGTPVPTFVIDNNHKILHWNHACELVSGIKAEHIVGSDETWVAFYTEPRPCMADLIVDGKLNSIDEYYPGMARPSETVEGAWEAEDFFPRFPDGGKWLAFTARALTDSNGNIIGAVETLRDITKQKKLEQEAIDNQHLLTEIIDGSPVPTFVIDKDHKVTHWNKACEAIIGTEQETMVGTKDQWKPFYPKERPVMADLVLNQDAEMIQHHYHGIWSKSPLVEGAWEATSHFPHFKSGAKWLYFTAAPIHGLDGEIIGAVETLQDITDQKKYEEQLEHEANHDTLTGLANRALLLDRMTQALAHAERDNRLLGVLFIDLDDFKQVNDEKGHAVGDSLLQDVTRKIKSCVREGDTVARLGGDEFIVLLFAPNSQQDIKDVTSRLVNKLSAPTFINGEDIRVGCSIGVSLYPKDGMDPETLMHAADKAMYKAKEDGKGGFAFYDI